MGLHKNKWALETIDLIKKMGADLGYITAQKEMRITRGWLDVSWKWNSPLFKDPMFLLIAEIETTKANWSQVRNNAAKAVQLMPLVYAHIFHPSIKLNIEERSQLEAIHCGRHVLIVDGNSDFQDFLQRIKMTDKNSAVIGFPDGVRLVLPMMPSYLGKMTPVLAIANPRRRFLEYMAFVSTIHNGLWVTPELARFFGIKHPSSGNLIKISQFNHGHTGFVHSTEIIIFGIEITCEVIVTDALGKGSVIVGIDVLGKLGAKTISFNYEL